jgi:hypothetical protein
LAESKVKETAVEPKVEKTAVDPMVEILQRAIPPQLRDKLEQLEAEHESNYRLHPDMVAVFDISTNASSLIDGVPPYYDVVTGSKLDHDIRGDGAKAEHTKQGLRITDRYDIVYNFVPKTEFIYRYTVIPRKEWDEYIKNRKPGMVTPAQELAGQMLRAGGAT